MVKTAIKGKTITITIQGDTPDESSELADFLERQADIWLQTKGKEEWKTLIDFTKDKKYKDGIPAKELLKVMEEFEEKYG